MRIGIDARYLSHGLVGGIHTYLANLLPELIREADEHQFYLYADTKRDFEILDLPPNVILRQLRWSGSLSSIYHDLFMKRVMEKDKLDLIHFPANHGFGPSGVRKVITLHDEINIMPWREIIKGHSKNLRTMGMMTYLHFSTLVALRNADFNSDCFRIFPPANCPLQWH